MTRTLGPYSPHATPVTRSVATLKRLTVEELLYIEAMGICPPGQAAAALDAGEFDIGGRVAVSPSGGLLSMGHPVGPTGVGQICEITTQLRCEAGQRQHPGARTGLAHMVGVGAVCLVHVLRKDPTV